MAENNKTVSYSQYALWKKCGLSWKLAYPDGLRTKEGNIHSVFGTAIHQTIQHWLTELSKNIVLDLNQLSTLFFGFLTKEFEANIQYNEDSTIKSFPADKITLTTFYNEGIEILTELHKNKESYFSNMMWELVGIEVPLEQSLLGDLTFKAYLDIVLRNVVTGHIKILDIKTSTKGWNKYAKEDQTKIDQVLLYKHFYSKQFNVIPEYVTVEFLILARLPFHRRIDTFIPSHSKKHVKETYNNFMEFVNKCFDETGNYKLDTIEATPSKSACMFCDFRNRSDLCDKSYYKDK